MPKAGSPRILIVDDEAAQMRALCDTLGDHGYETVGFATGQAALERLKGEEFHLLLTDLMMPEMDGIALLQAALAMDPNLVGIIMTGEGTIATAVEAMKTGALDYVLKPFRLSVVLPVLSRALAVRALRMENAALARSVKERTEELEAANKELEAFSYSISHDLRSPLFAIGGFTGILTEEYAALLPERAQRLLSNVTACTRRMETLVEDLLRFSRLGRQPLLKSAVSVSSIVRAALEELRQAEGGQRVEVRLDPLPDCVGDPALLHQVFVNLLSNAFKFTSKKDKPVVEIGCREQGAERVYFVRDNGAGFDMRYAERLFGVFQRFHSSEQFDGTGVGLSIVHRIVQRHGGRIWAEAEPDKGATFQFVLPA
jgi:signal transduction histidine kinase